MSIEQRGKNKEGRYKKHKQQQPMINESVGDFLQILKINTLGIKKLYCNKISDKKLINKELNKRRLIKNSHS